MIYEMYIIRKLEKKTINEALSCAIHAKKNKNKYSEFWFEFWATRIRYICENNETIVKRYNLACLKRSLILFYIASSCGVDVAFCMGFRHIPGLHGKRVLSGHAWIEKEGIPIGKNEKVERFTKTFEFRNF